MAGMAGNELPSIVAMDTIAIKGLQLPFGILAPDVWGKDKEQPALLSLKLFLRNNFDSAATKDALDDSTIHYGELAKRIRASCKSNQALGDVFTNAERIALSMAQKENGNFILARLSIEICLPKAAMFGEGVLIGMTSSYDEAGRFSGHGPGTVLFTVRDVKVMTMIGVNHYERMAKQPITATCTLIVSNRTGAESASCVSEQTVTLFDLERTLVQVRLTLTPMFYDSTMRARRDVGLIVTYRSFKTPTSKPSKPSPISQSNNSSHACSTRRFQVVKSISNSRSRELLRLRMRRLWRC